MTPSDAAIHALAFRLEQAETEAAYWQEHYRRLASNRLGWITALLRRDNLGVTAKRKAQFGKQVRECLRGTW